MVPPPACCVACGHPATRAGFRRFAPDVRVVVPSGRVPRGGGRVILGAAYFAGASCDAIARSGRTLVIGPGGLPVRGFHVSGRMLRWRRDGPEGFGRAYHLYRLAETAFSVIRGRFGAVARAEMFAMRELHLVLKCVCYNLSPRPFDLQGVPRLAYAAHRP